MSCILLMGSARKDIIMMNTSILEMLEQEFLKHFKSKYNLTPSGLRMLKGDFMEFYNLTPLRLETTKTDFTEYLDIPHSLYQFFHQFENRYRGNKSIMEYLPRPPRRRRPPIRSKSAPLLNVSGRGLGVMGERSIRDTFDGLVFKK